MRKEEYGLAAVGFLLLSLAFPPYFIGFLAASTLGGLGYLLKSLNEQDREELVRFEKEFRKGYELEHQHLYQDAEKIYRSLIEKYPKFAYIAEERIRWLKEQMQPEEQPPKTQSK